MRALLLAPAILIAGTAAAEVRVPLHFVDETRFVPSDAPFSFEFKEQLRSPANAPVLLDGQPLPAARVRVEGTRLLLPALGVTGFHTITIPPDWRAPTLKSDTVVRIHAGLGTTVVRVRGAENATVFALLGSDETFRHHETVKDGIVTFQGLPATGTVVFTGETTDGRFARRETKPASELALVLEPTRLDGTSALLSTAAHEQSLQLACGSKNCAVQGDLDDDDLPDRAVLVKRGKGWRGLLILRGGAKTPELIDFEKPLDARASFPKVQSLALRRDHHPPREGKRWPMHGLELRGRANGKEYLGTLRWNGARWEWKEEGC